jgi:hypothetical protein
MELVYKPEYRTQILHHAAVCDFDEVLFVVANEFKPVYSILIKVLPRQKTAWKNLVRDYIYEKSLKWAYTDTWLGSTNPERFIPSFQDSVISRAGYSIDADNM